MPIRTSVAAALLSLLALSGCTASPLDKQGLLAACEGRYEFGYGELDKAAAPMCDSMFQALVEVMAVIGKERPAGVVCIASDFQMEAFRKQYKAALKDQSISIDGLGAIVMANFISRGRSGEDCGWVPDTKLSAMEKDCRWARAAFGSDTEASFRSLAREVGVSGDDAIKDVGATSAARCVGYYYGALLAGGLANELYADDVYCGGGKALADQMNDFSPALFLRVVDTQGRDLGSSEMPAAQFFHEGLSREFRCPAAAS